MFCAAFENDVEQKDKQAQIKYSEYRESSRKTEPDCPVSRIDDEFKTNQGNAGKSLLEHVVDRRNCSSGFLYGVAMNVVDVGDGKCQLKTDADTDEYQADECNIRLLKVET